LQWHLHVGRSAGIFGNQGCPSAGSVTVLPLFLAVLMAFGQEIWLTLPGNFAILCT